MTTSKKIGWISKCRQPKIKSLAEVEGNLSRWRWVKRKERKEFPDLLTSQLRGVETNPSEIVTNSSPVKILYWAYIFFPLSSISSDKPASSIPLKEVKNVNDNRVIYSRKSNFHFHPVCRLKTSQEACIRIKGKLSAKAETFPSGENWLVRHLVICRHIGSN